MRKIGIRIPHLLFFTLALLTPVYCGTFVSNLWRKPESLIRHVAMWPHEALRFVWKGTMDLFSMAPYYAVVAYLLLLLACVLWFKRPKLLSGLALLVTSFLTGPSGAYILWILGGAKVGHP